MKARLAAQPANVPDHYICDNDTDLDDEEAEVEVSDAEWNCTLSKAVLNTTNHLSAHLEQLKREPVPQWREDIIFNMVASGTLSDHVIHSHKHFSEYTINSEASLWYEFVLPFVPAIFIETIRHGIYTKQMTKDHGSLCYLFQLDLQMWLGIDQCEMWEKHSKLRRDGATKSRVPITVGRDFVCYANTHFPVKEYCP
jgi:hypothetical protein